MKRFSRASPVGTKRVDVGRRGLFGLLGRAGLSRPEAVQAQPAQRGELFRGKQSPDSQFHADLHPQLCGLRSGQFVDSLIDDVFIYRFGVERLVRAACESRTRRFVVDVLRGFLR